MNEFATLMAASGTRPLAERRTEQPRRGTAAIPPLRVQVPAPPPPTAPGWAIGAKGMEILALAMRAISRDGALTRPNGQIVMLVRRDGMLVDAGDPAGVVTATDILKLSDAIGCEMIVISWKGRKAVFHPLSGAAVLTEDPRER